MLQARPHVCIATLSTQPEVLAGAVDTLLAQGYPLAEVVAIHSTPRNHCQQQALVRLNDLLTTRMHHGCRVRFRAVPVTLGSDCAQADHVGIDLAFAGLNSLLLTLKKEHAVLHMCLVGEQALLGLLMVSAALLYLDHADRIWHLPSPEGCCPPRLVRIPALPWGHYFSALQRIANERLKESEPGLTEEEVQRCETVYQLLTPRQREVLCLLANDKTPQQVAAIMKITLATVNDHKTVICRNCLNSWALPETTRLGYDWLRKHFAPYIQRL